jgi:hypothetical protein
METIPYLRKPASASMRDRWYWAVWQAVWILLLCGVGFSLLPSGRSIERYAAGAFAPALFSLAFFGWACWEAAQTRTVLRGRGRPSPEKLQKQTGNIAKIILAAIVTPFLLALLVMFLFFFNIDSLMHGSMQKQARALPGSVRGALSIYYGDHEGRYPDTIEELTANGKYLTSVPSIKPPNGTRRGYHRKTNAVRTGIAPDDGGGWMYNNVASDANYGTLWINCTHTDSRGRKWSSY